MSQLLESLGMRLDNRIKKRRDDGDSSHVTGDIFLRVVSALFSTTVLGVVNKPLIDIAENVGVDLALGRDRAIVDGPLERVEEVEDRLKGVIIDIERLELLFE